jgi:2-keto-4-pentenoate hydratase/2-oxohepta-3-ene-1,7-dioic acid hydratase in catechol pathway
MRIARFRHAGKVAFGLVEGENLKVIVGDPYSGIQLSGETVPLSGVELLAPTAPSKVICIGMNYSAHAAEIAQDVPDEPLMFFKPTSSVTAAGQPIVLPWQSNQVELECELAIVVGKEAKNVPMEKVGDYISRELFEKILESEEEHIDFLETQLQLVERVGLQNYCQSQMEPGHA